MIAKLRTVLQNKQFIVCTVTKNSNRKMVLFQGTLFAYSCVLRVCECTISGYTQLHPEPRNFYCNEKIIMFPSTSEIMLSRTFLQPMMLAKSDRENTHLYIHEYFAKPITKVYNIYYVNISKENERGRGKLYRHWIRVSLFLWTIKIVIKKYPHNCDRRMKGVWIIKKINFSINVIGFGFNNPF